MRSPPRVVFVLSRFALGGAEKQLAALFERRPPSTGSLELHTITFQTPLSDAVAARFRAAGAHDTLVDRQASSFPVFFVRLLQTLRALRPNLVHTVLDASPGTWGRLAAWLTGVPVLVHSDLSLRPQGTRAHRLLRPWLDRRTDRFLPNAQAIAERLVATGVPRERIAVIPCGVDLTTFTSHPSRELRGAWGVPEGAVVAGFLGRFDPLKRLDVLLDAVLALPVAARPDRLVLGGDGPEWPRVEARIAGDPWLAERCRLVGAVHDVPAFLAAVDYLVLSSEVEGLPNVLLEAMAASRPVVATRVSDVPGLVEGVGFLAEPGDARSLAHAWGAMQALDPDARTALGRAGRARVEISYDLDRIATRFWNAHLELLSGVPARRVERAAAP